MKPVSTVHVMIVDDSAVVRQVLSSLLNGARGIVVTHAVADPILAMERMRFDWPDVILLDIDMPRMDGLTFLRKIMAERPTPVIICSALTERGTAATVEALAGGAVSIITKPKTDVRVFFQEAALDLITAVHVASSVNVARLAPRAATPGVPVPPGSPRGLIGEPARAVPAGQHVQVIAIGASTGGTQALELVLTAMPPECPPIMIVQHMPEKFTAAFADRLDSLCAIKVMEARHGDPVLPGTALIAPGGRHMQLRREVGNKLLAEVIDGPPVNRHKPSVDVLFRSVTRAAGNKALGVILTGMGDDGATGLATLHDAGARTLAQDEASCVVFGMPREAIKAGAVDSVLSLTAIAKELQELTGVPR
ncbi:MAG TPA: chemotaxis response regulator protein-glutamate methylesterase [Burkholderiaceae bacterium]